MRRIIVLVLVIALISMSIGSVDAANSQGFEWGIEVEDRIDYTVSYYQPSVPGDPEGTYEFYARVISLKTIPDPVTDFSQITDTSAIYFLANGTQIYQMGWAVVAIGNWSLATELHNAQVHAQGVVSETATDWIIAYEATFADSTQTQELRFSKADGALNYRYLGLVSSTDEVISSSETIRDGYNPNQGLFGGIDPTLILGIGAVGVLIVIAALVVARRN
ncbi:MAG: hypothetical protein JSW61_14170 [Candidatus Thorarchaeota archaeon]|nr:MAG: hypothetical protein JSW61_14170 [Candidatus Thorarchaeota archaeon]